MHMSNRLRLLPVLILLPIVFGGGSALADPVNCGDIIVVDTKLEANLSCGSEPGLAIDADGVTLDLNGFTISGSSLEIGVFSGGFSGITIKNGSISGFQFGIYMVETADVEIKQLTFANQTQDSVVIFDGVNVNIADIQVSVPETAGSAIILIDVDNATVKNATVDGGGFGVLSNGDSRISDNLIVQDCVFANIGHEGVGIRIINNTGAKAHRNTIIGNELAGGCYAGIDVVGNEPSTHIHFAHNVITGCGFGIFVAAGPPSTDIHIQKNHLYANEDGIFLVGVQDSRIIENRAYLNHSVGIALVDDTTGNKILHNTASGNGIWDMGHTLGSVPNQWHANTCGTSEGIDVDCP